MARGRRKNAIDLAPGLGSELASRPAKFDDINTRTHFRKKAVWAYVVARRQTCQARREEAESIEHQRGEANAVVNSAPMRGGDQR